jgi:transcriptional regulator with XRE-family HTH domain
MWVLRAVTARGNFPSVLTRAVTRPQTHRCERRSPQPRLNVHTEPRAHPVRTHGSEDDAMDLGAVLRAARIESGLGQAEVARRAGVTKQSLCRWETGGRPVRSDDADRVLAACGRDVRFQLVHRLADIDDELARLAGLTLGERLLDTGLVGSFVLHEIQATGVAIFTGAWAAVALGLPPLRDVGGILVGEDRSAQARLAAVLGMWSPMLLEDGMTWGACWNDEVFQRNPSARWTTPLLGTFLTEVTSSPVDERRLSTDNGPWRVIHPAALVPDDVDRTAFERWAELAP